MKGFEGPWALEVAEAANSQGRGREDRKQREQEGGDLREETQENRRVTWESLRGRGRKKRRGHADS